MSQNKSEKNNAAVAVSQQHPYVQNSNFALAKEQRPKAAPKLNPRVTKVLFSAICLCYMLMHIDDGILSVASESIIKDLDIDESKLGLVEASMYVGIIFGSLVCPFLFSKFNPKFLVITAVIVNAVGVSSWAYIDKYYILAAFRMLNGIFLV